MCCHIYKEPSIKLMSVKACSLFCQQRQLKTLLSCQKAPNEVVLQDFLPILLSIHQGPTRKKTSNVNGGWGKAKGGSSSLKLYVTPTESCQESILLTASLLKDLNGCQTNLRERLSLSVQAVKKITNHVIVAGT